MGQRGPGAKPVKVPRGVPQPPEATCAENAQARPKGRTRADRLIAWIEGLKITSGMHAGRPLKLRPWQKAIIRDLYRTDRKGKWVVRQALITLPRKNGKTQLAAALACGHLCGPEAESRGQIYSAAADRAQAALIYAEMRAFILADPKLADRVIIREFKKELEDAQTGSVYQALSSDARKAHGLSPSFYIADELAQWPSRDLLDNLTTGTGARAEPLGIVISTQSADPFHVMSELVRYGEGVRDGTIKDPTFAAHIFAAPMDADPWDPAVWKACNPALGDFLNEADMRTAAEQAQRIPAREAVFRNLRLNQAVEPDGGALTFDAPADLMGAVADANAEQGSLGFVSNTKVRRAAAKLKDGQSRPYGLDTVFQGMPRAFSNVVPSNLTKGTGTNLSALIYGNWSDLLLGYWSELDILVNPFEASAYAKGNVQVRAMMTVDIAVRHPESFAAITDIAA